MGVGGGGAKICSIVLHYTYIQVREIGRIGRLSFVIVFLKRGLPIPRHCAIIQWCLKTDSYNGCNYLTERL